ncbi:MAG: VWA domain-containing protein [Bacteroidales bacterium]|nr:VWA domain-containing protein [Bacteroidales bacterium]
MTTLELAHKEYLWLLLIIIPLIAWYIWKHAKRFASFNVSTLKPYNSLSKHSTWLLHLPFVLRILVIILITIVLAQPQSSMSHKQVNVEGIDITIALDVSGSMLAMDFKPNRLEACKSVIRTFVENRPTDRIGLVLYAGEAYTKCPLTTDHSTLLLSLESSNNNQIDDGTAIGDGLGTAINRLRESEAKSKVIILLSDGMNNSGYIDPLSAAELAKEFGIRVYTIGCGSMGEAPYKGSFGIFYAKTEIDESLLQNIASITGGKYFRAQNKDRLKAVYDEIDQMEKSKISETQFTNKNDAYFPFLCLALLLFVLEIILSQTILKIHP